MSRSGGPAPDPLSAPLAQVADELLGATLDRHSPVCVQWGDPRTCDGSCLDDDPGADLPPDEPFAAKIERARYRPSTESEADVTADCIAWLSAQPGCCVRKVHGGALSGGGEPDLDICWHGRAVKIELKANGGRHNRPTRAQQQRLLEWQAAGALVGWARSVIEVRQILARADDPGYRYVDQAGAPAPISEGP